MKDTGFWVPPDQSYRLVVYFTSATPGFLVPIPFAFTHTDFSKVIISGFPTAGTTCQMMNE